VTPYLQVVKESCDLLLEFWDPLYILVVNNLSCDDLYAACVMFFDVRLSHLYKNYLLTYLLIYIDTVACTFSYHTWQFIIFTIFTITTCIFSYSLSVSF